MAKRGRLQRTELSLIDRTRTVEGEEIAKFVEVCRAAYLTAKRTWKKAGAAACAGVNSKATGTV